jgi:hypothetical protein
MKIVTRSLPHARKTRIERRLLHPERPAGKCEPDKAQRDQPPPLLRTPSDQKLEQQDRAPEQRQHDRGQQHEVIVGGVVLGHG